MTYKLCVFHNGNLTDVVMLDLSAAFDSVDHQQLLFKPVFLKVTTWLPKEEFEISKKEKSLG